MENMSSFNLSHVDWSATARLTLARGLSASLVWCVVLAVKTSGASVAALLPVFFQLVPAFMIGAPLFHLIIRAMRAVLGGLPGMGLAFAFMLIGTSFLVAVGDPIVFIISRRFPGLVGVADFKVFNLVPAMFVSR